MKKHVLGILVLLAMGFFPMTASAHTVTLFHGLDYVTVAKNHMGFTVCDQESDGNMIQAHYTYAGSDGTVHKTYALDYLYGDSVHGCTIRDTSPFVVRSMKIC